MQQTVTPVSSFITSVCACAHACMRAYVVLLFNHPPTLVSNSNTCMQITN